MHDQRQWLHTNNGYATLHESLVFLWPLSSSGLRVWDLVFSGLGLRSQATPRTQEHTHPFQSPHLNVEKPRTRATNRADSPSAPPRGRATRSRCRQFRQLTRPHELLVQLGELARRRPRAALFFLAAGVGRSLGIIGTAPKCVCDRMVLI